MRKLIIVLLTLLLVQSAANAGTSTNAQWIWQQNNGPDNTWMAFRKTINLDEVPAEVLVDISVDTKYWLWINGEMVLFEGGLARGAAPNTIYYDPVDIAPFLKQGENTIAILVWHWGRTHKTHEDSGKGGLCLSSSAMPELNTNASWKMKLHPAYDPNSGGNSSPNRPNPFNVKFDGRTAMGDWTEEAWYTTAYDDSNWSTPIEKGGVNASPWGTWVERAVPQWNDRGLVDYEALKVNSTTVQLPYTNTTGANVTISAKLPFNQQITPFLKVKSSAGKTLVMDTDNGSNLLTGTYITRNGTQQFESYTWINGHNVEYTIPAGVEVIELKYRWTGVGEMTGSFECSDDFYTRLWWMARNTLYVCARDNYMDCPDRERGLWIGDVADQAGAIFYTLDEPGRLLLKKAIDNTIAYRDGDTIQGLAPGFGAYRGSSSELASQSLQFIAQGIWQYYYNTGDTATLDNAYPAVLNYLKVWNMMDNGLPEYRKGYANWVDWGEKTDVHATVAIWYYMALNAAKDMALTLGQDQDIAWLDGRINSIKDKFMAEYWRGTHYSTAGRAIEERVTALSVISGLADSAHYDIIAENNLFPVREASPHMEWIVEEALIQTGHADKALQRMQERYKGQVNRPNLTTLYEKFTANGAGSGTPNHAWNAPNFVLSRYITGIKATEVAWSSYEVCPNLVNMTSFKSNVPSVKGDIKVEVLASKTNFNLKLESPEATTAIVGIPKKNTTIIEVKLAGQTIWKNEAFVSGVQGVTFHSEDEAFLKFEVLPGQWEFDASIFTDDSPEIVFSTPTDNTVLESGYEALDVTVNASDDIGLTKVDLYADGQLIATKTEAPYQWNALSTPELLGWTKGEHSLKAIATDTKEQTTETSIKLTVIVKPQGDSLVNKMIFYYPLESDGADVSGKQNHGKIGSAVTFPTGKYGNAAAFSFIEGSYLTSADSVFKYSHPTAYTIAFWIKVTDYSERRDIIQPVGGRTLLYSNGDLLFKSYHQKQSTSFNITENEKDEWFHVAIIIDQRAGQTQQMYYINGEQRGSHPMGYALEPDKSPAIGRVIFGSTSDGGLRRNFGGLLDEVCMFDDVLSQEEVQFLMNPENFKEYLSEGNTGINKITSDNRIQIYPVPAKQCIHLEGADIRQASIFSLSGSLIKKLSVAHNQVDVSMLESGMYILQAEEKGVVSIGRFVVQ